MTYVDTNATLTYYEVAGQGEPLVLLHGGLATVETWAPHVATLSEHYQVFVPERYGHGRTADIDGPLTYETQAEHTIAFMEAAGIESAHLAGWSDGAMAGLLVALRRPKLVRKLVFLEQFPTLGTAHPGFLPLMQGFTHDHVPPFLRDIYNAVSPDGADHFPVVFDKLHTMWCGDTGIELADLAHVSAPTLLLMAQYGSMKLDALAATLAALPNAQLAIVPGASHGVPLEKPHIVNQLIVDFLADEQPELMFPDLDELS
jgi:pimeloyl-ACP methyl ester carboxylesterase